jgi:1,4-dihydroxy-2-naphthoyl-CoA synthase
MRDSETILAQLRTEGSVFGERLKTAEAMEAFMAFQQKRPPDFSKF